MLEDLREELYLLHLELPKNNLVAWTGGTVSARDAAPNMARLKKETFKPDPHAQRVYDQIYADYSSSHDYFGRGVNDVMKRMKQIRNESRNQ